MQNAFNLKSNSLDERVKVLSTCRDDELVFKCYTKQYGLGCKHYLCKCQVYCVACDRFYFADSVTTKHIGTTT